MPQQGSNVSSAWKPPQALLWVTPVAGTASALQDNRLFSHTHVFLLVPEGKPASNSISILCCNETRAP